MAHHRSGGQGGGDVTTLTSITGLGVGEGGGTGMMKMTDIRQESGFQWSEFMEMVDSEGILAISHLVMNEWMDVIHPLV